MPVLNDRQIWSKWAARDLKNERNLNLNWATLPPPLQITAIVPNSSQTALNWKYTNAAPGGDWMTNNYDDANWKTGAAPFGMQREAGLKIGTTWEGSEIWARREVTLTAEQLANRDALQLAFYHDDDGEIYLNGVPALNAPGATNSYETFAINRAALNTLKPGRNVFAVHVRDTGGDKYFDMGLVSTK